MAELGIACEACHGPGKQHAKLHQNPATRYLRRFSDEADDDIVNPARLDNHRASEICGKCHAELVLKGEANDFVPGQKLSAFAHVLEYIETDQPQWLRDAVKDEADLLQSSFWKDGTIRVAGRDFNGLAVTGCYTRGAMSCQTCHAMHGDDPVDQLRAEARGDTACSECHPAEANDITAHTHHPANSAGSRCYNCHMPHTTVGLLKLIRSHRVDSPVADIAAKTGRPTACNLCHLDKSLAEVSRHLTDWYGQPPGEALKPEHTVPTVVTHLLKGNAVQRGTAAWHMAWAPAIEASGKDWQAPYLAQLLDDPYAVVRAIAYTALGKLPGYAQFEYDYTMPEAQRGRYVEEATNIWQAVTSPQLDKPTVRIRNGKVDEQFIFELKQQRDDQPIRVNE